MHDLEELARLDTTVLDGSGDFHLGLSKSRNLVEDGKYSEAAEILSGLITSNTASGWKTELTKSIGILQNWAKSGNVDIASYREFYLGYGAIEYIDRTRPLVALWRMPGIRDDDKLLTISEFIDKRCHKQEDENDRRRQLTILQAIPHLADVTPKAAATALLEAGNIAHRLHDLAAAERNWMQVLPFVDEKPEWLKATYNLGVLMMEKKSFDVAIDYFKKVLDSKPDNREMGAHLMEPCRNYSHYSANNISTCYESLGDYAAALTYTELAQTRYRYETWCGNDPGPAAFLKRRIAMLRGKIAKQQ